MGVGVKGRSRCCGGRSGTSRPTVPGSGLEPSGENEGLGQETLGFWSGERSRRGRERDLSLERSERGPVGGDVVGGPADVTDAVGEGLRVEWID